MCTSWCLQAFDGVGSAKLAVSMMQSHQYSAPECCMLCMAFSWTVWGNLRPQFLLTPLSRRISPAYTFLHLPARTGEQSRGLTDCTVRSKLCGSIVQARLLNCMRKSFREEGISPTPLALGLRNHDLHLVVRHLHTTVSIMMSFTFFALACAGAEMMHLKGRPV